MTKAAVIISAILLLAGVAAASTFTGIAPSSETPTLSIPDAVTTGGTTTNDDTTTGETTTVGTTTQTGPDISGPCDEAEHANDPRCTGIGVRTDRDDDDRRGPNRGPGRGDDRDRHEDNSGPGNARDRDEDRHDDDNSGSGGSDDNSGPGGGGEDD